MLDILEHDDRIRELRLARPPVNALNPDLMAELLAAVQSAESDERQALIISGRPGLFSAGLDVPELLTLDRPAMIAFWKQLFGLLEALARAPMPITAALTGHSPAGGTVIALFCDYRIMAEGKYQLGLNEVEVGLVVPLVIHRALCRLIGTYAAERHLVAGQMINAQRALDIGLVDELQPVEKVVERSLEWCRTLLAKPRHSMQATRQLCRSDVAGLFDQPEALDAEAFADFWFRDETQATLKEMVARIKAKTSA